MPLRHEPGQAPLADFIQAAISSRGTARHYEYDTTIYRDDAARFWLDLTQPDVRTARTATAAIAYHPDGSWARFSEGTVTQGGPRSLWDDVERSHRAWVVSGQPSRDRYRLAIAGEVQEVLLDDSTVPVHQLHVAHGH